MTDPERIASLESRVKALETIIAQMRQVFTGSTGDAASDRELDSEHGDQEVKVIPHNFKNDGVHVKGMRMSECDPEFLDAIAELYSYFAEKNDASRAMSGTTPKSVYDRRSAKLARGWARRKRDGWKPPEKPKGLGGGSPNPFAGGAPNPFGPKPPAVPAAPPTPSPTSGLGAQDNEENINW